MKRNTIVGIVLMAVFTAFFINATLPLLNDDQNERDFHNAYKIYSVPIPAKLDFAGETIPLEYAFVRENLDREISINTYWASATMVIFKRANRYMPVMEPIFHKYGVPTDLAYVAMIESQLSNVISPAAAVGFWQFTKAAATENGLEVNDEVDERYNIQKSTEAACKLFKSSYERLGSWTLAAAAYNAGKTRILNAMTDQQIRDFYHLYLNDETSRYLYRILALKLISKEPQRYGFYLRNRDLQAPVPMDQIVIESSLDDLVAFARKNGVNYKILKDNNPWLRKPRLSNPQRKSYIIQLPKPGYLLYDKQQRVISHPDDMFKGF